VLARFALERSSCQGFASPFWPGERARFSNRRVSSAREQAAARRAVGKTEAKVMRCQMGALRVSVTYGTPSVSVSEKTTPTSGSSYASRPIFILAFICAEKLNCQ